MLTTVCGLLNSLHSVPLSANRYRSMVKTATEITTDSQNGDRPKVPQVNSCQVNFADVGAYRHYYCAPLKSQIT